MRTTSTSVGARMGAGLFIAVAAAIAGCGAVSIGAGSGSHASDGSADGSAAAPSGGGSGEMKVTNPDGPHPPAAKSAMFQLPEKCSSDIGMIYFTQSGESAKGEYDNGSIECKWNGVSAYDCAWKDVDGTPYGNRGSGSAQLWAIEGSSTLSGTWGNGGAVDDRGYFNCMGVTGHVDMSAPTLAKAGETCTLDTTCEASLRCVDHKGNKKCVDAIGTQCSSSADCTRAGLNCRSGACAK